MSILLDLFNLAIYVPFLKVDEEDIGKNILHLKKHQWFKDDLSNKKYQELIIYNQDVRQTIGKFKTDKLHVDSYNIRCKKRLHRVLNKSA